MERTEEDVLSELLVLKSKSGDSTAIPKLVELWQPRLLLQARRIVRREDVARDIVQEAWVSIVRGIQRLEDPARFRAWALRIVTNKAHDWARKQQRQKKLLDDARELADDEQPSPIETNEVVDEMRAAIRQLPAEQRTLLTMLYVDELPLAVIAETLEIPVGTVKSRLHNTRKELKVIIERNRE